MFKNTGEKGGSAERQKSCIAMPLRLICLSTTYGGVYNTIHDRGRAILIAALNCWRCLLLCRLQCLCLIKHACFRHAL